jgi:hypothetical protein
MAFLRDADIDPAPLADKRVAILGYGNQGRAQALNLHDSGIDVVVGLRGGSGSANEVEAAGLETALVEDAVASADVAMMLAPDEIHGALYKEIAPHLREGAALGFSHGLSVRFGFVEPRADLGQHFGHPLANAVVDNLRAAQRCAQFGGIGNDFAHPGDAARLDQLGDEVQLADAFEVGDFGGDAPRHQRLEARGQDFRHGAPHDRLLVEQVRLRFLGEG